MTRVMFPPSGMKAGELPFNSSIHPTIIHPFLVNVYIPTDSLYGKVGMWPLLVYGRSSPL